MVCISVNLSARNMAQAKGSGAMRSSTATGRTNCLAQPARRPLVVLAASIPNNERYARAAAKFDAGPMTQTQKLYVRPSVLNLDPDEFDVAKAIAAYTAVAASNPLLHSLKQQEERSRQQQPGRSVSWSEIL